MREKLTNAAAGALVLVALLCTLAVAGHWIWKDGYMKGKAVADAAIEKGKSQNNKTKADDAVEETKTVTEYIEVERIVYRDGKTIIQKVPEYVSIQADAACTVPMGFVSLHDHAVRAANMGEESTAPSADTASATAADALPVPQWADLPAGLPLSDVQRVSVENATRYRLLKNRYEKLVQWSQTQCYGPP